MDRMPASHCARVPLLVLFDAKEEREGSRPASALPLRPKQCTLLSTVHISPRASPRSLPYQTHTGWQDHGRVCVDWRHRVGASWMESRKKIKQASSLCALKQAPRATALKTSSPLSTSRTSAPRPVPYPPSPNRRPTCPSGTMMGRLRGRSVDWRRSEAEGVESHARPVAPSQPTSHPIPILPSHIILRLLFPFLSRLPATIRRSTSSRKPSTRTPSGAATTSWSCATRTTRPPRTGAPRS